VDLGVECIAAPLGVNSPIDVRRVAISGPSGRACSERCRRVFPHAHLASYATTKGPLAAGLGLAEQTALTISAGKEMIGRTVLLRL